MVSSIVSSRSREGFRRPSDREDIDYRLRGQLGLSSMVHHKRQRALLVLALGALFTQVTLLWSSGAAPSDNVGLVHWHCRRATCAARDQHAVDLPGDVALETADDLALALALCGAP